MSDLTQYKLSIGDDKKNTLFGVTFSFNTFLDGLAELGVDKRLIKNKKILSDLLEKEKIYRENEGEGDDDSNRSDSSDDEESQSESNDAESVSESDRESIIQKESSKPCHHCQNRN